MLKPGCGSQDLVAITWKPGCGSQDLVARTWKPRSGSENDESISFYRQGVIMENKNHSRNGFVDIGLENVAVAATRVVGGGTFPLQ